MQDNAHPLLAYAAANGVVATLHTADRTMASVADAAYALGIEPAAMTKNLLFMVDGEPMLFIAAGPDPVDRRRIARHFGIGRKRVKLATPQETLAITGYVVGCVPPFGHKKALNTLIEAAAMKLPRIYGGTADPQTLISVTPHALLTLINATVLDEPSQR